MLITKRCKLIETRINLYNCNKNEISIENLSITQMPSRITLYSSSSKNYFYLNKPLSHLLHRFQQNNIKNKSFYNINLKNNMFQSKIKMEKSTTNDIILEQNYSLLQQLCIELNNSKDPDAYSINSINSVIDNMNPLKLKIGLTPNEEQIFNFIKMILKKYELKTICRVAGGWVRDKILGKFSDDIDIALDNMSGEEFALIINKEIKEIQEKETNEEIKNKSKKENSSKVAVVKVNPDKSKHLATATMRIFGQHIDFVNLRTETYSDDSRIPQIDIGTAKEDALRRDITINTLFYNINENKIEDLLDSGISDLKNRIIRTPIDAEITFNDDPLRILRCIRFATRFEFNLAKRIIDVAKLNHIKLALKEKVSNERIKKELKLMFSGKNPFYALYILYEMTLFEDILKTNSFGIKQLTETYPIIEFNNILVTSLISDLILNKNLLQIKEKITKAFYNIEEIMYNDIFSDDFKNHYFSICLAQPFNQYTIKLKKDLASASLLIIRNSLMSPNEEIELIKNFNQNLNEFMLICNEEKKDRLKLGLLLRRITSKNIISFLIYSIAQEFFVSQKKLLTSNINLELLANLLLENKKELTDICNKYINFAYTIKEMNLFHVDELKALFNGNEIINIFKVKGPKIGIINNKCIEMQLLYPNISKDELKDKINESLIV